MIDDFSSQGQDFMSGKSVQTSDDGVPNVVDDYSGSEEEKPKKK